VATVCVEPSTTAAEAGRAEGDARPDRETEPAQPDAPAAFAAAHSAAAPGRPSPRARLRKSPSLKRKPAPTPESATADELKADVTSVETAVSAVAAAAEDQPEHDTWADREAEPTPEDATATAIGTTAEATRRSATLGRETDPTWDGTRADEVTAAAGGRVHSGVWPDHEAELTPEDASVDEAEPTGQTARRGAGVGGEAGSMSDGTSGDNTGASTADHLAAQHPESDAWSVDEGGSDTEGDPAVRVTAAASARAEDAEDSPADQVAEAAAAPGEGAKTPAAKVKRRRPTKAAGTPVAFDDENAGGAERGWLAEVPSEDESVLAAEAEQGALFDTPPKRENVAAPVTEIVEAPAAMLAPPSQARTVEGGPRVVPAATRKPRKTQPAKSEAPEAAAKKVEGRTKTPPAKATPAKKAQPKAARPKTTRAKTTRPEDATQD
jgi:hypothetical protein